LLAEAGAKDEQEFRQRTLEAARARLLSQEREALTREIGAALADNCSEDAVERQLEGEHAERLAARRDELIEHLAGLEKKLQQHFEKRGQLTEQMKALAEDRRLADKQLELATVETRLQQAVRRWQMLALTSRILATIRTVYEQQRQPETLQEASGYLCRLTRGRYTRVWTPLGEDVLRVDDAQGDCLAVEMLSRGTREQLFLSLRLALAACYARRGAPLPLILDDVLVNFDADRAKAAAAVLRDFAAAGHQLLIFTCHEHILKLFKSLKVPVNCLPHSAEKDPAPLSFQAPAEQKSRRKKTSKPSPRKVAAQEEELDETGDEQYHEEWEQDPDEADDADFAWEDAAGDEQDEEEQDEYEEDEADEDEEEEEYDDEEAEEDLEDDDEDFDEEEDAYDEDEEEEPAEEELDEDDTAEAA
jgi:hypothetical protein